MYESAEASIGPEQRRELWLRAKRAIYRKHGITARNGRADWLGPANRERRQAFRDGLRGKYLDLLGQALDDRVRQQELDLAAIFQETFFAGFSTARQFGLDLEPEFKYVVFVGTGAANPRWVTFRNAPSYDPLTRKMLRDCAVIGATKSLSYKIRGTNSKGKPVQHIGYPIAPRCPVANFLHVDIDIDKQGVPVADLQPQIRFLEGLGFLVLASSPRRERRGVWVTNGLHAYCFFTADEKTADLRAVVSALAPKIQGRIDVTSVGHIVDGEIRPWESPKSLPLPVFRWKNEDRCVEPFREMITTFFLDSDFRVDLMALEARLGIEKIDIKPQPQADCGDFWCSTSSSAPEERSDGNLSLGQFRDSCQGMLASFLGNTKMNGIGISNTTGNRPALPVGSGEILNEIQDWLTGKRSDAPTVPQGQFNQVIIKSGLWRLVPDEKAIEAMTQAGGDLPGRIRQWAGMREWSVGRYNGSSIFNDTFLNQVHQVALRVTLKPGKASSMTLADKQLYTGKALAHFLFAASGQGGSDIFLSYQVWQSVVQFPGTKPLFRKQCVLPLMEAGLLVETGRAYVAGYDQMAKQPSIKWSLGDEAKQLLSLIPPPPVVRKINWVGNPRPNVVLWHNGKQLPPTGKAYKLIPVKPAAD